MKNQLIRGVAMAAYLAFIFTLGVMVGIAMMT